MKTRFVFYLLGIFILTLGIALILKAHLGAAAWDALAVGESTTFHLSVGTFVFINGMILIFINSFLLKKKPEFLAAITVFVIGMLIDFWLKIGLSDFSPTGLGVQITTLFIGILALGIGIASYLQAKFPASPMDTIMIAISTRFGLSYRSARMISEGLALASAIVFHGAIGVGTIIVTITIGFVIQLFFPILEQLLACLTKTYI
ncbi:putative membrane protein YczE [Bacillus pakistanensis]|uniref:Membrane protein YczE n=1 Tax=Rossellomorea pakistanensis TaxID=992288 RepID=A0ABS2NIZ7_9BACI|nr:hypothetical protein [Bacillus pakistanensis]MBM7587793.1 putative membrane protein YczE [Bacillus pakistanensis]